MRIEARHHSGRTARTGPLPAGGRRFRRLHGALFALLLLSLGGLPTGCGGAKDKTPFSYRPQDSPAHVLENLVDAYQRRDVAGYQALLADDFRFEFEMRERHDGFDGIWNLDQEMNGSARLFGAADVSRLWLALSRVTDEPVNELGHEAWRRIVVPDTYVEIDLKAQAGEEPWTLRVDGDVHEFLFRKGRTPNDTLPDSPSAERWYLVAWRDLGRSGAPGAELHPADQPLPIQQLSYSAIKLRFAPPAPR